MTYEQALLRAAAYCSKAEHAPRDVEQKLQVWCDVESDVERIMDYLRHEKYLDEARFVHAFVNDKFIYERWGRTKISYMLRQKGIESSLINITIDDLISPDEYLNTLCDLLRPKLRGTTMPLDQKERAKLYRFAAQRGFESEVISSAIRICTQSNQD